MSRTEEHSSNSCELRMKRIQPNLSWILKICGEKQIRCSYSRISSCSVFLVSSISWSFEEDCSQDLAILNKGLKEKKTRTKDTFVGGWPQMWVMKIFHPSKIIWRMSGKRSSAAFSSVFPLTQTVSQILLKASQTPTKALACDITGILVCSDNVSKGALPNFLVKFVVSNLPHGFQNVRRCNESSFIYQLRHAACPCINYHSVPSF